MLRSIIALIFLINSSCSYFVKKQPKDELANYSKIFDLAFALDDNHFYFYFTTENFQLDGYNYICRNLVGIKNNKQFATVSHEKIDKIRAVESIDTDIEEKKRKIVKFVNKYNQDSIACTSDSFTNKSKIVSTKEHIEDIIEVSPYLALLTLVLTAVPILPILVLPEVAFLKSFRAVRLGMSRKDFEKIYAPRMRLTSEVEDVVYTYDGDVFKIYFVFKDNHLDLFYSTLETRKF